MALTLRLFLFVLALWGCAVMPVLADDDLPNFNAPVDNAPLNVDKVNRVMGVTMFKEPSLWDEDDGVVARRLGWPGESMTSKQSSFRLYPTEKNPMNILGARVFVRVLCDQGSSHGGFHRVRERG